MPLVHTENITEECRLMVWELTESVEVLHEMLPAAADMVEFSGISHPQKRREWLAGRVLLGQIVSEMGETFKGTWKDAHGKPHLVESSCFISITHTFDYVAAVIHPSSPIGIDMEKMDAKLQRTARKYLNETEMVESDNTLSMLGTYWCAKEALYKLNGRNKVSFKNDISIDPFDGKTTVLKGTLRDSGQKVRADLHLRWFGTYCLVVAEVS
ncbi:4'-phosphopantetheinyl transferase family protein [Persicitalea jodogahamensis]|uniref:4'-phosphopantetheinyl transferase superfamily protein n=1 Tax=Persicitalea jodogahamensis TaxID=402147 RepID=A0A8J3GAR1_9BACT|nr:4'-phosphopantetheinyl transferase superfamily protein [Persicitalea jodogahamensis]GHB71814.1 hypothetical protein GCM10007390_27160 [Persicitalea jodogahamensis]